MTQMKDPQETGNVFLSAQHHVYNLMSILYEQFLDSPEYQAMLKDLVSVGSGVVQESDKKEKRKGLFLPKKRPEPTMSSSPAPTNLSDSVYSQSSHESAVQKLVESLQSVKAQLEKIPIIDSLTVERYLQIQRTVRLFCIERLGTDLPQDLIEDTGYRKQRVSLNSLASEKSSEDVESKPE